MPIEPLPDSVRGRLAQFLREWASRIREEGWDDYEQVLSSGEVAGVRAVLGEPGAVDAAVEQWAATLWGLVGAEADAAGGYERTRRWFAETAASSAVDVVESAAEKVPPRSRRYTLDEVVARYAPPTYVTAVEPRGGTVLRITHQSGLIHDSDLAYTGANAEAIQAARVIHGGVVVQLAEGTHHIAGHELEEHALYGCPGECGWKPGDSVVIRNPEGEQP